MSTQEIKDQYVKLINFVLFIGPTANTQLSDDLKLFFLGQGVRISHIVSSSHAHMSYV